MKIEYSNIQNGKLLLTICYNSDYTVDQLGLDSWLKEWLIEDYEISIGHQFERSELQKTTFVLQIPLVCIKPDKLSDVISHGAPNSYPQTKRGSKFRIVNKCLV